MQSANLDLNDLLEFSPEGGIILFGGERALLFDASAFGLLRKDLVDTFGITVARGFLTRFGFAQGWRLAETLSKQLPFGSDLEVSPGGANLLRLLGQNTPTGMTPPEGLPSAANWLDSFEAEQHLMHHGRADQPVCWSLCGLASGWLSYFRGEPVYCLEDRCQGKGDAHCTTRVDTAAGWGPTYADDLAAFDHRGLDESLERLASAAKRAERTIRQAQKHIRANTAPTGPIAESPAMQRIIKMIGQVSKADTTILITGESGTGKEMVARSIHDQSNRCDRPFIAVNCGALPEGLLESELFGHARGSFTGASQARVGLFEAAQGGTLFLDEVGDMTPATQVKVLRALQEREIRRVGENTSRPVNVRVLAATNRDLSAEIAANHFRQDLYYRLRVIDILIPPLRERPEDILPLARRFLDEGGRRLGKPMAGFQPQVAHRLLRYHWPGNVRELQNVLERAILLAAGTHITPEDLPDEIRHVLPLGGVPTGPAQRLDEVEKAHILAVLQSVQGSRTAAARILGIGPATLFRKLRLYKDSQARPGSKPPVGTGILSN